MTTKQEQIIRGMLRAALSTSSEPDPTVIAKRVALKLPRDLLLQAAMKGLMEIATEEVRSERKGRPVEGPSRWAVIRENVGGTWRSLDNLNVEELRTLAEEYRVRGNALLAKANEIEVLAEELARSGCATVGEMRKSLAA